MKYLFVVIFTFLSLISFSQTIENELIKKMDSLGFVAQTSQYADISEDGTMFNYYTFLAESEYEIAAFSVEAGVLDIDLYLVHETKTDVIMHDSDAQPLAMLHFKSSQTQRLRVAVQNFNSELENRKYRCKYLIFKKVK
jgi:hypothetical protein